ncbi:hypothetical protein DV736_g4260, partial [Chaetothyriales sp. CBS 134916]
MGGPTHEHLQQLASAVMFPGHGNSVLSRADVLPADSGWNWKSRQIVDATERADFYLIDAADLARELVAATLVTAKTRTEGPGAEQWARSLLAAALYQYREIENRLEFEGTDFGLKCFDMYAQMLDLLAAWNLCCERQQTMAMNYDYSHTPGGHVDVEGQRSTYQQRFMSFLPRWSSPSSSSTPYKVSTDCEQDLVFASFITLALITKLRYKMLRGLDADARMATGAGAGVLASTDASLLNLRNVSLLEAAFLRLVGQAGQGTPFNRIHLRLAWARIGCSPAESKSIGRTIDNLHAYNDYLLIEAERCFSQATGTGTKGRSSPDAHAMAPAPLLAWIHYADAQALRPAVDILRTLQVWVGLGQPGPCKGDALQVLDHFQETHDDMSYAAAWSTLRNCQDDGSLEAHFQQWVRHLWARKEYDRVVSLHRNTVQLLSKKLRGDNDYVCSLTQICLELQVQDPARGMYTQRMFHNVVRVGIQPNRQVWRQWMRVKLKALEFLNAVRALWRYKMFEGEEEDIFEEACIYLLARLDKIKADTKVLLEDILFDISRAVSIGLKEADCERLYMLREAGTTPLAARAYVISLHERLIRSVCESQPGAPNRLKVAAAVHMHLLHCIRVEELPQDQAARVTQLEETIATEFWKGGRDEQVRMLCKQRYNKAWPPRWARLPVVKSQKLVKAWLARSLAQRQLSFDLGHTDYADVMFKERESLELGTGERKVEAKKTEADKDAGGSNVTHYLSAEDTIASLSLQYRVPASVLRRHNRLATDGLVAGRKTVAIPRSHYSGRALSRVPNAEEEERKNTLRRWMVATKCAEYEVGVVYLRANGYSLDRAVL